MSRILLIGCGGFVGSVLRYLLSATVQQATPGRFPWGTAVVNIAGCFAIGVLAGIGLNRGPLTDEARALIVTGLLGGFTTFSAFAHDVVDAYRTGAPMMALGAVGANVGLGLGAAYLGR